MDQPATTTPATARDVILELVRNMRDGLEPLQYSALAPAIYHVYLHPDDYERLRGILPRIEDEARRALDQELADLNRASLAEKLKLARPGGPKIAAPDAGWQIRFFENTDEDTQPGDIVIYSELALPAKPEFGAGSMTKRISTGRVGGQTRSTQTYQPEAAPDGQPAHAVIDYEDNGGRKQFRVSKDQVVIGRGGRDYWTDLKLDTLPDVSREHVRLRRDPATGRFYLKDLSRLGTTVNGERVPSSIEYTGETRRDKNLEVPLPAQARIGLAGVIFLDFQAGSQ
jgi:hypothetical protein